MRISKARWERIKAGARRHGSAAGSAAARGAKGSLISAATGAVSYFGATLAADKVDMLRSHPLIMPGVIGAVGHFLKRKQHDVGTALLGIAGFTGAMAYQNSQQQKAPPPQQPAPQAHGFDAGALVETSGDDSMYAELPEASGIRDTDGTSDTHPEAGGWGDAGAVVDAEAGDVDDL